MSYPRLPNASSYIQHLNALPQPGIASQQQQQQDPLANFEDDLTLFSNSELFDFDLGGTKQEDYEPKHARPRKAAGEHGLDFVSHDNFNVFDPSQAMPPLNTAFPNSNTFDSQLFHSPQSAAVTVQNQQLGSVSPTSQQATGQKRPHSPGSPDGSVEDVARAAAEEDKRRRNTAASARFRVKKKQREAALEKSAKENADRVGQLQKRVDELEMENKWLRDLVVQKEGKANRNASGPIDSEPATIASKQVKKGVGTASERK